MYLPPLVVDVTWWAELAHEKTSSAGEHKVPLRPPVRDLALKLYSMLRRHVDLDDPNKSCGDIVVRPGVGIPVALGRPLDAIASEIEHERGGGPRTLRAIVPLLDEETYVEALRDVRTSLERIQKLADREERPVLLLPVTLHKHWDAYLMGAAPVRLSFVPESKRLAQGSSGVGVNLATWLMRMRGKESPHVTIFVSHAKADLAATDSAAIRLNNHIQNDTQIKTFFDAKEIERGGSIADQLVAGARDAVLLSLRTDNYAESAWCHEEVLTAKALQVPVISVWSVRREERRALPYGGNMPTLVWNEDRLDEIVERCLTAWLHYEHFRLRAPAALALADIKLPRAFLSRPPELVDFALGGLPVDRDAIVLYPDPPLPAAETRVLRLAHPRVRLATPTTLFGSAVLSVDPAPPLATRTIALSLSESPQAYAALDASNSAGYNALHVQDAIAHLTLCIVRSGARLAYGGHLRPSGFTPYIAAIIATHNAIGASAAEIPLVYLANYLRHERSDINVERVSCGDADIRIDATNDISRRVGEALQLRAMRMRMAVDCDARVAIGGRDISYSGRYPGVVEECWRMLEAGKPIYPIGGFGGAASLLVTALLGACPPALREARLRAADAGFDAFCTAYDQDERRHDARGLERPGRDPASLDELAARIAEFGAVLRGDKPDAMWTNGLTVAENRRLFETRDLTEISHLVMKGMAVALGRRDATGASSKKPTVRLFRGSITDVAATEAYAVPVVNGLSPTGAALALDERLAGRIRDRLQSPILDVEAIDTGGARLAGRSVLLVPLAASGHVEQSVFQAPKESIDQACSRLAAYAKANKLTSIAVVPFGANIGLPANASIIALVSALERELKAMPWTVTVCELLPERYDMIRTGLNVPFMELPRSPVAAPRGGTTKMPIVISVERSGDHLSLSLLPPADDTTAVVAHEVPKELSIADRGAIDVYARTSEAPAFSKLSNIGVDIAKRLLGNTHLATLAAHSGRPIDIVHDITAAAIPWELMALEGPDGVVFPARHGGLRRRLLVNAARLAAQAPPRRLELGEKLRVLVVVNPRGLTQAAAEAARLQEVFEQNRHRIQYVMLEGPNATVPNVVRELRDPFDVFHYAGHASFDSNDPGASGLHLADAWLTPERIVTTEPEAIRIPALVVLNACTSARVRGELEPEPMQKPVAPSLAESILVAGARTFIGTFWKVYDRAAATFADELYRRLLSGDSIGTALVAARRRLAADEDADWVNYNLYGDTELRW